MGEGIEQRNVPSFDVLLRKLRHTAGLTQEQLAERAHVSVRTIRNLEAGMRHNPRSDTLRMLIAALELRDGQTAALLILASHADRRDYHVEDQIDPHQARYRDEAAHLASSIQPHALPVPPTELLGRSAEVEAVVALLTDPSCRLVTVCGPPGVGKSHLALVVASHVAPHFPDGVVFISLASLREAQEVMPTIAQALALHETSHQPVTDQIAASLALRSCLLVLDNGEHVAGAATQIADLLAACPVVRVLLTSRAPWHLRGEQLYPLAPLPIPDLAHLPPLKSLNSVPSVALFVARARGVLPSFAFTRDNAPTVAAICARMDGLPLAIELAAAWVSLLSPDALLSRLGQPLPVLRRSGPDRPVRHQSLHQALEWSYALLERGEQALFRRLAILADGGTIEAIEAIAPDAMHVSHEVLDHLASLVEKSLVQRDQPRRGGHLHTSDSRHTARDPTSSHHGTSQAMIESALEMVSGSGAIADGVVNDVLGLVVADHTTARVRLLDTIRAYAHDLLIANGEADVAAAAHARYFLSLAENSPPELQGRNPLNHRDWLAAVEADYENMRSALQWAIEHAETSIAWRLACALWQFWYVRGQLSEGRRWMEAALTLPWEGERQELWETGQNQANQGKGVCQGAECYVGTSSGVCAVGAAHPLLSLRAKLLNSAGFFAARQGAYEQAEAQLEEGLILRRQLGDIRGLVSSLSNLGLAARYQGELSRAEALLQEGVALARVDGNASALAIALNNLATLLHEQNAYSRAQQLYQEAYALARTQADERMCSMLLGNLGEIARERGLLEEAQARFAECLVLQRQLGDVPNFALTLDNLGQVALQAGQEAQAWKYCEAALALHQQVGDERQVGRTLAHLGEVAISQGDIERASELLERSYTLGFRLHDQLGCASACLYQSRLAMVEGDYDRAAIYVREALPAYFALHHPLGLIACLDTLMMLVVARMDYRRAVVYTASATTMRTMLGIRCLPSEHTRVSGILDRAALTLDVMRFARAWMAGRRVASGWISAVTSNVSSA